MTPQPAPDIRLELYVEGSFVRTLVITAADAAARSEAPTSDAGEPPRVYQDVALPPGDRLAINLVRHYPGRDRVATYTADGKLVTVDPGGVKTTTYSYSGLSRPKPPLTPPEEPPDEPHVTDSSARTSTCESAEDDRAFNGR